MRFRELVLVMFLGFVMSARIEAIPPGVRYYEAKVIRVWELGDHVISTTPTLRARASYDNGYKDRRYVIIDLILIQENKEVVSVMVEVPRKGPTKAGDPAMKRYRKLQAKAEKKCKKTGVCVYS